MLMMQSSMPPDARNRRTFGRFVETLQPGGGGSGLVFHANAVAAPRTTKLLTCVDDEILTVRIAQKS
ncbi:hypothetical protein AOQ73_25065 [Bradyrhizobium pachyrhizi]|nr:hypothetical protein AOQ73_25065 [Bradyrhizobium pachyrhizi]